MSRNKKQNLGVQLEQSMYIARAGLGFNLQQQNKTRVHITKTTLTKRYRRVMSIYKTLFEKICGQQSGAQFWSTWQSCTVAHLQVSQCHPKSFFCYLLTKSCKFLLHSQIFSGVEVDVIEQQVNIRTSYLCRKQRFQGLGGTKIQITQNSEVQNVHLPASQYKFCNTTNKISKRDQSAQHNCMSASTPTLSCLSIRSENTKTQHKSISYTRKRILTLISTC